MRILFSDACCTLMAPKMAISNPATQVQRPYCWADSIKLYHCFHITHCSRSFVKVSNIRKQSRLPSAFNSAEPRLKQQLQGLIYRIVEVFKLQNGEETQWFSTQKRAGQPIFFTDTSRSPETFSNAGCNEFIERLQSGCHQSTAEAFAKTFNGNKARVGSLEILVDEAAIAAATSLPRTGQSWFKTTATKNLNFRAYLKEEFKHNAWKKGMPVSYLEEEWQELFKGIQLYITSEGRYDKLMMYHFKLMDHFTGKTLLNLPFFLHKSLTKVCKKIRAQPLSMKNTLCHFGLIKLIILEELKQQGRSWQHFLFGEGFETQTQPVNEQGKGSKKQLTPQSSSRKRRTLPGPPEDRISRVKSHRSKKRLIFETTIASHRTAYREENQYIKFALYRLKIRATRSVPCHQES
jgi:hypothetical protein